VEDPHGAPLTLALINDYDVVVIGVAHMFDQYTDRVRVVELNSSVPLIENVDIALYDSFAQPEANQDPIEELIQSPKARRVVIYTWNFHPVLIEAALDKGAGGYLSKALPAGELVEALEVVRAGEIVVTDAPPRKNPSVAGDWPGRAEGLTEREAEILALITQGKSNSEIAATIFLSPNSIKSYIRTAYRKIGVTSRVQAVLWGVDHGFRPNRRRIENWFPDPMVDLAIRSNEI